MAQIIDGIGFDEVEAPAEKEIQQETKTRSPWFTWETGGKEYRLKLATSAIAKLEKKYGQNVMNLFADGIPQLSVMLTVLQASMEKYHHGMNTEKIMAIYDNWVENEDGSQVTFMKNVILPILAVSGFFTTKQAEELLMEMEAELA